MTKVVDIFELVFDPVDVNADNSILLVRFRTFQSVVNQRFQLALPVVVRVVRHRRHICPNFVQTVKGLSGGYADIRSARSR